MLKLISCLSLLFLLTPMCSNVKKSGQLHQPAPAYPAGEQPESRGETPPADFHYAVRFQFTSERAEPVAGVREAGDMPLLVTPASELFTAIYAGGNLIHYFSFADPLAVRAIDDRGEQKRLERGAATLLFPASLLRHKAAKVEAGIYAVNAYMADFQDQVQTDTALRQAVRDGRLVKRYTLDSRALLDFLKKL